MENRLLIRGATILTMSSHGTLEGDILIEGNRLVQVGGTAPPGSGPDQTATRTIQADGLVAMPGLVQVHVHLCQSLFRGMADDLELLPWLAERIWPLEAAHDEDTLYWSALLGIAELFRGGTTCIGDMETVHHTEAALTAMGEAGIRAVSGKVMLDRVPPGWPATGSAADTLVQPASRALEETAALGEKWHGAAEGRIHYAVCPRFALSCSESLLRGAADLARSRDYLLHTHAAENRDEVALVRREHGCGNVEYLDSIGLLGRRTLLAHCVHLSPAEEEILARTGTGVAHCPSANLKLGSGVAALARLRRLGVRAGIGADGAPCNNNLDALAEMRLASLLQKEREGPASIPAGEALRLATIEGAGCLGLEEEIGSLEPGKRADLILVDLSGPHCLPAGEPVTTLAYAARAADVRFTVVDGRVVLEEGRLVTVDETVLAREVRRSAGLVRRRAGLN